MKNSTQWIARLAGITLIAVATAPCQAQQSYGSRQPSANNEPTTGQPAQTNNLESLQAEAQQTINIFKQNDPNIETFFHNSAAYAVFPKVGEGAFIVGGAHGQGLVYQNGQPIGETTVTKGTVGAQVGGESFAEVIFFQNQQSLQQFKQGNFEWSGGVNAVGANSSVGAVTNYRNGVAVFTTSRKGLMAKAAVGAQKFTFQPLAMGGAGLGSQSGSASGSSGSPR